MHRAVVPLRQHQLLNIVINPWQMWFAYAQRELTAQQMQFD
jgi:hypothetical protein